MQSKIQKKIKIFSKKFKQNLSELHEKCKQNLFEKMDKKLIYFFFILIEY